MSTTFIKITVTAVSNLQQSFTNNLRSKIQDHKDNCDEGRCRYIFTPWGIILQERIVHRPLTGCMLPYAVWDVGLCALVKSLSEGYFCIDSDVRAPTRKVMTKARSVTTQWHASFSQQDRYLCKELSFCAYHHFWRDFKFVEWYLIFMPIFFSFFIQG